MKVNESDLVSVISKNTDVSERDVKKVISDLKKEIKNNMKNKITTNLKGFATFKNEVVSCKKIYNFKLKQSVEIPKRNLPKIIFNRKFINELKAGE